MWSQEVGVPSLQIPLSSSSPSSIKVLPAAPHQFLQRLLLKSTDVQHCSASVSYLNLNCQQLQNDATMYQLFIWSIRSSTVFDWLCLSQNQLGYTSGASVFAMQPGKTSASLALLLFSWHQVSTSSAICDDVEAWKYLWTLLKLCKSRYHSITIWQSIWKLCKRRCISTSRRPSQLIIHQTRLYWKIACIASTTFSFLLVLNQLHEALAGTRALARRHQEICEPYISHFSMCFHPFFCWTTWKHTHKQQQKCPEKSMSIVKCQSAELLQNLFLAILWWERCPQKAALDLATPNLQPPQWDHSHFDGNHRLRKQTPVKGKNLACLRLNWVGESCFFVDMGW